MIWLFIFLLMTTLEVPSWLWLIYIVIVLGKALGCVRWEG